MSRAPQVTAVRAVKLQQRLNWATMNVPTSFPSPELSDGGAGSVCDRDDLQWDGAVGGVGQGAKVGQSPTVMDAINKPLLWV